MSLWELIKSFFVKEKKNFITIVFIVTILLLGSLSKTFFFYNDYFIYFLFLCIIIIILFVLFLYKKKEFKSHCIESLEEDIILNRKIKKNKKDYFHIDRIIKIMTILIIISMVIYQINKSSLF